MADQAAPTAENYQALYELSVSNNKADRAKAAAFQATLSPDERKAFYDHINQQTAASNKARTSQTSVLGVPVTVANDPARPDSNMIGTPSGHGIAPEDALMAGLAGKAVVQGVKSGTGLVGGTIGGVKAGLAAAAPAIKFQIYQAALEAMGVPRPLAASLATAASMRGAVPGAAAKPGAAPAGPAPPAEGPTPFNELSLSEQMAHLPTDTPAPVAARGPAPPMRSPATANAATISSGRPMGAADFVEKINTLPADQRASVMQTRGEVPGVAFERQTLPPPSQLAPKVTEPMPASAPPLGTTPPPAPSPENNVTAPANPQPPRATTPANTPPPAAASPKVQAAADTISGWTPDEYNAVKDLPVNQRVAYLRMRQGGYAADDAMATVQQIQKAEQAQTLRAMKGSKKAAAELFNVSEKKVTPEMLARVKEMAPGPSRTPLEGVNYAMDERFKEIALNDPRFQSLLRGGGLGDLATRGAP